MPGRLAVDFGTSNTVLARWDESSQQPFTLELPDYGAPLGPGLPSVVPSLIHYDTEGRRWLGRQVLQQNLYQARRTFRWMKRYIGNRTPLKLKLDEREISPQDAGREFLSTVLGMARAELGVEDEEVAFTLPVECFEHYEEWLVRVVEESGLPRYRFLDEPSAAALGYGAHIQAGDVYLIFDLGGGTLDVSVVKVEEQEEGGWRRCRVLGKAGADLGGATFDQWLFEEVLRRHKLHDYDDEVRRLSRALLVECERAKERLSFQGEADLSVIDPDSGRVLSARLTQGEFEALLDEKEAFRTIDQTLRRALRAAGERGFDEESVKNVLLVGGSTLIPSVQRTLHRIFGRERVLLDRPIDAVARGAAAFVGGVDFYDHIQHDYGVRHMTAQGTYDYRVIVPRGTPYPCADVCALKVKAYLDGQTQLGLAIYEMGQTRRPREGPTGPVELVFDNSGAARLRPISVDEEERRTLFWMNEKQPTFLEANPPARKGETRFEARFSVDDKKRLLLTARDLTTGRLLYENYPVVRLT
ncbi:MAG: Hsp70 family protein [Candidatus Eremiobacterota bacterium]